MIKIVDQGEWKSVTKEEAAMYFCFLRLLTEESGGYVGATQEDSEYIRGFYDSVIIIEDDKVRGRRIGRIAGTSEQRAINTEWNANTWTRR